jgi:hypothetical protein
MRPAGRCFGGRSPHHRQLGPAQTGGPHLQSASGTYRLHNVPVHFADRKSAGFKKAGTSATRVRAAITWLLAQHLDGKEP